MKIVLQHAATLNPRICRTKQMLILLLARRNQGLLPMYHFPRNSTLKETWLPIGKSGYRFGKRMKLSLAWTNNLQRFVSPRLSRVSVQMHWKYTLVCRSHWRLRGKTWIKSSSCGRITALEERM